MVDRLRARGLTVKVTTRRADNGLALLLEDTTPAEPSVSLLAPGGTEDSPRMLPRHDEPCSSDGPAA
jgi:hypothetical protein